METTQTKIPFTSFTTTKSKQLIECWFLILGLLGLRLWLAHLGWGLLGDWGRFLGLGLVCLGLWSLAPEISKITISISFVLWGSLVLNHRLLNRCRLCILSVSIWSNRSSKHIEQIRIQFILTLSLALSLALGLRLGHLGLRLRLGLRLGGWGVEETCIWGHFLRLGLGGLLRLGLLGLRLLRLGLGWFWGFFVCGIVKFFHLLFSFFFLLFRRLDTELRVIFWISFCISNQFWNLWIHSNPLFWFIKDFNCLNTF